MEKNKNNINGITLVALVITIIILLILAGISISALTNTGIFQKAKEAKEKSKEAQNQEEKTLNNYLTQINTITFSNINKAETTPELAIPQNSVIIESDANKGIVIKDANNNEWVWIIVPKNIFKTAKSKTDYDNIKNDLIEYAKDYRYGNINQNCYWKDEWYDGCGINDENGKTGSELYTELYNEMLSSTYTNGGFWISRYEIGDKKSTEENITRTSSSGITGEAVSKPNQIPYNYLTCAQAQTLAKEMSIDSNKTSSLLFGIQWDLLCKFLQEQGGLSIAQLKSGDSIGSTSFGNYSNNSLKLLKGKYNINLWNPASIWTSYNTDTDNYVINSLTQNDANYYQLLTTGASEQTKKMNIYDLAGNLWERTLEHATSLPDYPCADRGGSLNRNGFDAPVATRSGSNMVLSGSLGFRCTIF